MSFTDGAAYNEKLIPICRGDILPDRMYSQSQLPDTSLDKT
jgi:hypothetical protein